MLNEIIHHVIKSHGSLEQLNYRFKKKYVDNPISPEFEQFKKIIEKDFEIFNFTEINTDVADMAEVKNNNGHWCIRMSWVGPFAAVMRINGQPWSAILLDPLKHNLCSSEVFLIETLQNLGFKIPDENTLLTKIKAGPVNPERDFSYVYELLFTENEIMKIDSDRE